MPSDTALRVEGVPSVPFDITLGPFNAITDVKGVEADAGVAVEGNECQKLCKCAIFAATGTHVCQKHHTTQSGQESQTPNT